MLKPGLRNNATASGEHLPQRSKGKTPINQGVSLSQFTKEQKSGYGVCVIASCIKKKREINLWDEVLKALLENIVI